MEQYIENAKQLLIGYGLKVIGAVLILVIGIWIAKLISRYTLKLLEKRNVEKTLSKFVSNFTRVLIIIFVVMAAINQVGIETTSFVAVLGAAGLAVGLALQGSLSNFAAGVMLIIFRPIKVGEFIEAGSVKGNVEEIGIFTSLVTGENDKVFIIPNSKLMNDVIVNHNYKKRS
jgi:small conductance mechanosensitive channel